MHNLNYTRHAMSFIGSLIIISLVYLPLLSFISQLAKAKKQLAHTSVATMHTYNIFLFSLSFSSSKLAKFSYVICNVEVKQMNVATKNLAAKM